MIVILTLLKLKESSSSSLTLGTAELFDLCSIFANSALEVKTSEDQNSLGFSSANAIRAIRINLRDAMNCWYVR